MILPLLVTRHYCNGNFLYVYRLTRSRICRYDTHGLHENPFFILRGYQDTYLSTALTPLIPNLMHSLTIPFFSLHFMGKLARFLCPPRIQIVFSIIKDLLFCCNMLKLKVSKGATASFSHFYAGNNPCEAF